MAERNWFEQIFGNTVSDARRALIEEGWFGRAEPRVPGSADRALDEKLYPDKEGERGFLGWLQAEDRREQSPPAPEPDLGIDR